jgi:hypothetical protein
MSDAEDTPDGASEADDETYVVKEILAERVFLETDENGVDKEEKKWLVWWDGYGLHEWVVCIHCVGLS